MKNRFSKYDHVIIFIALVLAIGAATVQSKLGAPQKWHAAIVWTVVPFSVAIMAFRRYLLSWRFWLGFFLCLGLHLLAMWEIFGRLLAGIQWLGTIYVAPFQFIETFVLIVFIGLIMRRLGEPGKYIRIV